jgi:integrase
MSTTAENPTASQLPGKGRDTSSPKEKKLLDQYREALRVRHYSYRTEGTYVSWVRQFILFHQKRHPREMGVVEINAFVTYLVNEKNIAASTQNQVISSILFLYRHVLDIQLDETALIPIRPTKPKRVPTVLSKDEARQVIAKMGGVYRLMAQIMYGSGLLDKPHAPRRLIKRLPPTPFATPLPPTYYRMGMTSAPSRSFWATRTSKPP